MPSLIADNVVQVVMEYRATGLDKLENVYHVHKDSDWTPVELEAMVALFESWEAGEGSEARSVDVELVRITATDLTSLTSARVDSQLTTPIPGQIANPVLPSNVTFAVKANIGERGKGRNGRTFWIGLAEPMVTGDEVAAASADLITSKLNALVAAVQADVSGAELGIIHTRVNGAPISPATFSPIRSFAYTDLGVDSQRDRLPGHKRHKKPTP